MKILVTGGTGFLGKALALRLTYKGHSVSAFGRNINIGKKLEENGIRFIAGDLTDPIATENACQGQDVVFHCGALSSPWGTYRAFYRSNVLGTQNIIQGCHRQGIRRLIHVSTPSIYFDYSDRFNISEEEILPKRSCNPYAKSKRLAEELVLKAHMEGLKSIIIRPRGIFGPGDTTIIPRLIRANTKGGIPLIDEGKALIDITYIDNVVDALFKCLTAPDCAFGHCYNISNGESLPLKEILDQLFATLNEPPHYRRIPYQRASQVATLMEAASTIFTLGRIEPLLTRYTVGVLSKSQTLDISAAKHVLGYEPRVSIKEGLHYFAQWWKTGQ